MYNLDKVCASCCCKSHGNQFFLKCKLLYTGKYKNYKTPFYICRFGSFCQWAYFRLSKFSFVMFEYNAMSEEYERRKHIHGENYPVYHIHVLYIYLFLFLVQNKFIFISSTEQTINI